MPAYSVIILVAIVASLFAMFVVYFIYQQIKAADRVAKMYAERNAKREVVIESLKSKSQPYVGTPTTWAANVASKQTSARKVATKKSDSSAHSDDCVSRHVINAVSDADYGSPRYSDYSCGSSDTSSSATCD